MSEATRTTTGSPDRWSSPATASQPASYGILQFGTVGCVETVECIDDANTEFVMAEAPAKADVPQVPVTVDRGGDGTLKLGSLLPKTGSLAFLGPPEFAGIDLAVREMNAAGGVLGSEVSHIEGDSGDTENAVAPKTVSTLLAQDVDAIIGAPSTSVTLSVIDTVTNAGVVMFSPAATSKTLSDYDDQGLLFRAAPSDILQGAVLAETVAGDGHRDVYILALNDDYGTELADDFTTSFEANGGSVAGTEIYDPKATTFADVVGSAKQAEPDAVLLLGFDETSKILAEMIDQDIGPSSLPVYGVDGNMGNALVENFEAADSPRPSSIVEVADVLSTPDASPDAVETPFAPPKQSSTIQRDPRRLLGRTHGAP